MKKLLLLAVLFGIIAIPVSAQTVHWSTFIDTSTTFSSPRPVQLNGDNVLDIVIGGGLDGSAEARGVVAIDGATGGVLWNFPTKEEIFGSAQFRDINGDNVPDVFIGGRFAEFYAIDGATGAMIWEFFSPPPTEAVDSGWFNFYSPQFIPDQNSDGYDDILVANGGNHSLPIFDTLREPGMLMVIDAITGNVLAKDTMPDGEETYCSPVVVDFTSSGNLDIIFGSGGENDGGNLYKVSLADLMLNDISGAQVLATNPNKGYIAPASITDLNADGTLDIVSQGYDGTVTAINGVTLVPFWTVPNVGTESSSAPTIGDFIGDMTPDVFVVLAKGSAPSFFDYYQVLIDGATGNIAWKDSIGALHFSSANAVDLDLNGRDEVIVSLNNHTGTHFEHELMSIDFQNNIVSSMYLPQGGVNLGSTPLIHDLDSNGLLDIVFAFRADSVNPMGANGFKINRIEDAFTIPGSGIAWGSYMGTNFDG
ncbi:MAG: outer membrane protein assembly factor BamB, partial [Parvicellaceae bacterium]